MTGRRSTRPAIAVGAVVLVTAAYAYGGLVIRWPSDAVPEKYRAEAQQPSPEHPAPPSATWSDPAPGGQYVGSPDERYLALTREARRAYHTVFVWDERTRTLHPVVSIQEGDPGSGASHVYRWSSDSNALFITGWGALPLQDTESPLSYVYVVSEDRLYRVTGTR